MTTRPGPGPLGLRPRHLPPPGSDPRHPSGHRHWNASRHCSVSLRRRGAGRAETSGRPPNGTSESRCPRTTMRFNCLAGQHSRRSIIASPQSIAWPARDGGAGQAPPSRGAGVGAGRRPGGQLNRQDQPAGREPLRRNKASPRCRHQPSVERSAALADLAVWRIRAAQTAEASATTGLQGDDEQISSDAAPYGELPGHRSPIPLEGVAL